MLKTRVITATILVVALMLCLFKLSQPHWALISLLIATLATLEWSTMLKLTKTQTTFYLLGMVSIAAIIYILSSTISTFVLSVSLLFWILFVPILLFKPSQLQSKVLLSLIGYIVILPTWYALVLLRDMNPQPWVLIYAMALVWIADTSAYFSGKLFGKNKLAPMISPGKTREGVMGAILFVMIYAIILCIHYELSFKYLLGAFVLTILSVYGDLFESWMKRRVNMKDSGNILPGHGGVLDRIDGLTSTLPLVALFFTL